MKLRRIIAAASAIAVAAATTVTSFAASAFKGSTNQSGMFACLLSDDPNVPLFTDYAPMSDFTSFKLNIKAADKREIESAVAEGKWIAGEFGFNSQSTGWKKMSWGLEGSSAGDSDYIIKAGEKRGEYVLEYSQDTPIFASTDTYAQVWIQNYADAYEFEIVSYTLMNSKGEDITKPAAETPAEPEAPVETPDETPAEPTVEEAEPTIEAEPTVEIDDETVEVEETVEADDETVEADDADVDVNDYFDGGTVYLVTDNGAESYIDASGADITEILGVKFNVTFDDAEVADDEVWVGGGVGANSNSTGWEQHEWGKESGMKEITPDFENGTITWFKGEPIFTDAEEYAQLWIQSWGGALTVDSVELLYADYEADDTDTEADADANVDTPAADDSASANKGNPDTGVAGAAVAAGVVALAGVAVVASRKRK